MKRMITAVFLAAAVLTAGAVQAKQKTVAGDWTLLVEGLPLKLVLAQSGRAVTGTLDYPHGTPFQLVGTFKKDTLTFSGDSTGDNFTVHIQSTSSLKADGSLSGAMNAHFIETNDAHEVRRTRDQVMMWTAVRKSR